MRSTLIESFIKSERQSLILEISNKIQEERKSTFLMKQVTILDFDELCQEDQKPKGYR